jgi:TusA-related sulfurtransferase
MSAKILDAMGMKCPQPLFEVHRFIKTLAAGDVLEVRADDPAFRLDIEAWCKRTGHVLLELDRRDALIVATIKKVA